MKKIDNLKLFDYCLKNPEPIIDDFYVKMGNLLISKDPTQPTELMRKNSDLIEGISAYNFSKKQKSKVGVRKAIEKILEIVKSKNINYSEFVSFWPVVDISYSIFNKMSQGEQLENMRKIVDKYIELRHNLYSTYGYSPTTLQVGKDAKAHKESGSLGVNKVSKILDSFGFEKSNSKTIEDFVRRGSNKYIEADKKGKKLFKDLLSYCKIKFLWSKNKEQKMPDFLIKCKGDIFIIEHKHMKESGGGQDKQVNEIISLIGFGESNSNIHYVSFLDGIYFNLFSNKKYLNRGKILNQLIGIKENLKKNPQNYFVNTAGFKKMIKDLIEN